MGEFERVGHGTANQNGIRLFQQPVNDLDFVRHLGAAQNNNKWAGGVFQFIAKKFQFAFHQQASRSQTTSAGDNPGNAFG